MLCCGVQLRISVEFGHLTPRQSLATTLWLASYSDFNRSWEPEQETMCSFNWHRYFSLQPCEGIQPFKKYLANELMVPSKVMQEMQMLILQHKKRLHPFGGLCTDDVQHEHIHQAGMQDRLPFLSLHIRALSGFFQG